MLRRLLNFTAISLVGLTLVPARAWAQSSEGTKARDAAGTVADGIDGLPGLYRLGVPGTAAPRVGGSLWFGYGYTEPQQDGSGGHQSLSGTATVGGAIAPFLAGSLRVDVRHDIHSSDSQGGDSGTVLDFSPILRSGFSLGKNFLLGAEVRGDFMGAAAESGVAAPVIDGRLLGSFVSPSGLIITSMAGARSANTGSGVDNADRLRPGDRVTLGLSESPSALMGLGAMKRFGKTSLLLEWSWDLLLGKNAPPAGETPMTVGLGMRQRVMNGLNLQAMAEVDPLGRPPSAPTDPLAPVIPRFSFILGVSVRFPDIRPKPVEPEKEQAKAEEPAAPLVTVKKLPPPPAPKATLNVEIVDETGHPISDAQVTLRLPKTDQEEAKVLVIPLDNLNLYTLADLPPGSAQLVIEAALLERQEQTVNLLADEPTQVAITLKKSGKVGAQLRGLVRSYAGSGVKASIRVEPGGHAAECNENGEFTLDLPPGRYTVIIDAEGYASQQRKLSVKKEGVTVLNADLQRKN